MDRKTDSVSVPGILGRMSPEALSELIFNIANTLVSEGKAGTLTADLIPPQAKFAVMRPKDRAHGDWASNAAMQLAKKAGMKPRDLAELFAAELTNADGIKSVEVAPASSISRSTPHPRPQWWTPCSKPAATTARTTTCPARP